MGLRYTPSAPSDVRKLRANKPLRSVTVTPVAAPKSAPRMPSTDTYAAEVNDPIRRLGLNFAMGFLFFRFTGLHEIATAKFGVNTYILYVLGLPAILGMLLSGGLARTIRSRAAKYWAGFAFFLILSVPLSDWVSGSLTLVLGYLRNEISVLFLIAGLVITWRECWRLLGMISISSIVVLLLGQFFREETMGGPAERLTVATGLTMGNANDYAAVLTLLLPFLGLVLITPGRAFVLRCVALCGLLFGLYMILSTGSRGGLIACLAALIMMLLRLPPLKKMGLAVAAVVIGVTMWRILPDTITNRLATLVSDDAGGTDAIASGESRQYLLQKSLLFTVQHPLLGVGPGQFINHEGLGAKAQGYKGAWHETHNAYTQISSEVGIPAVLLFIGALLSTFHLLSGTLKQARARPPSRQNAMIAAGAFCALIAVVAFCSSSFFLSLGYRFYFPALTGIAIVLNRAAQREWDLAQS